VGEREDRRAPGLHRDTQATNGGELVSGIVTACDQHDARALLREVRERRCAGRGLMNDVRRSAFAPCERRYDRLATSCDAVDDQNLGRARHVSCL